MSLSFSAGIGVVVLASAMVIIPVALIDSSIAYLSIIPAMMFTCFMGDLIWKYLY